MVRKVIIPKLGQTMESGIIVEWLKEEGDTVQRGEALFTVESDKATLEVESPGKGFLRKILVPAGEERPVLTVVALITKTLDEDTSGYDSPVPSLESQIKVQAADESGPVQSEVLRPSHGRVFASPRARKQAQEKGVDLALVTGTGPNGRIVERDVSAYLEAIPTVPRVTPVAQRLAEGAGLDLDTVRGSGPGGRITKEDVEQTLRESQVVAIPSTPEPEVLKPLSGVRGVIARHMHKGHTSTAPVTLTTEVDATALVQLRERLKASMADKLGFSIGYNDLLIKLVSHALREFPYMNVRLEDTGTDDAASAIRHLDHVHVALAVDTERGLLVPVVRDADRKALAVVARELRELVERARAGQALPDELTGSTFTITNLGMHEIDAFTPIINLPEVAILGVGRIKARAAVAQGEICVRELMWLSLTFDHRLVDGAPAARFLQYIKSLIEEPYLWFAAVM